VYYSTSFDIAGPGVVVAAVGGGLLVLCIATGFIIGLESLVLWRLRWGGFKRALLAGFMMNIATTILGIGVVPFTLSLGLAGLLIDFALSILVEGGILMLFKRGVVCENWVAALVSNIASYILVILPLYLFFGLLG
jgi:hypothetical protein